MKCSACGKPTLPGDRFKVSEGKLVKLVCWRCKVKSDTGYDMPERRN